MPSPSHICPKCHKAQGADAFANEKGAPTKWCLFCRIEYRDRMTSLHQRDATKPKRGEEIDAASVATREGYKDHPLASLLALSHIAGAKRALAIRDGKSWRGKKAWRAYYEAKRELETSMEAKKPIDELVELVNRDLAAIGATATYSPVSYNIICEAPADKQKEARSIVLTAIQKMLVFKWLPEMQRDPNSSGVS